MLMIWSCLLVAAISLLPVWPHDHDHEEYLAHMGCDHSPSDREASPSSAPSEDCETCLALLGFGGTAMVSVRAPARWLSVITTLSPTVEFHSNNSSHRAERARAPPIFS